MQVADLKKYISEDEDRIITILEYYGFHSFWTNHSEIRCAAPNGSNKTAVVIKIGEKLFASYYSDSQPFRGDLIGLCEKVSGENFKTVNATIHTLMGLSVTGYSKPIENKNVLDLNKYVRKKKYKDNSANKLHDISYLNRFTVQTHADLYKEAILPKVAEKFHIGFDLKGNRITFPHFDWIEHDKIVGVQGRVVGLTTEQANMLGVPKYWNYIKGYKKSLNLYGWNFAEENVLKEKKLILFEAEKSVLKQFSFENGNGYSVALGGHEISNEQVKFILKHTPVDCEIIIAFDKDIMANENYLISCCKKFSKYRKTSYIFDNATALGEKDSPVDKGYAFYKLLFGEDFRRKVY